MKWNQAVRVLGECEQRLRGLAADAANAGEYADVVRIADLARAVAALASDGTAAAPKAGSSSPAGNGNIPPATAVRRSARPPSTEAYPRFFRRGSELVKVGWSKKERKEYNHRAARGAVDAVAAAVRTVGAKGKLFNGDALLPLKDAGGQPLPDYQAYVALAWLKHLGVVDQRGIRSGYILSSGKPIETTITAAWPELAEWTG